jgi:hypothetical protein
VDASRPSRDPEPAHEAQTDPAGAAVALEHERQQRFEVPRCRALADHDPHASRRAAMSSAVTVAPLDSNALAGAHEETIT